MGNWGTRGTTGRTRLRRQLFDRQVTKAPAHVVVLAEATKDVQRLLETPYEVAEPDNLRDPHSRVQQRPMREHFVVRGAEAECALPIAVRTDVADRLECLYYNVNDDFLYRANGKQSMARTRMMVCQISYKQNLGHLGKSLVVM